MRASEDMRVLTRASTDMRAQSSGLAKISSQALTAFASSTATAVSFQYFHARMYTKRAVKRRPYECVSACVSG